MPKAGAKLSFWGLLEATGVLLILGTCAGFLASLSWLLELACHFRVQYAVGLGLLAIVTASARRWRGAAVFAVFALVNAVLVVPAYLPHPVSASTDSPRLRLMLLNVHTANTHYARVLELIRRESPDVVVLQEVNGDWLKALGALGADYSHSIREPREDNFGIALFSKLRLLEAEIVHLDELELPAVHVQFDFTNRQFSLLGMHPLPPTGPLQARSRDDSIREAARRLASEAGDRILIGDLNTSPWSPVFRALVRESGLRDTRAGFGIQASWPTQIPPLGIPLDHCLVSPELVVLDRRLGPAVGSDHRPVILELARAGKTRE
jgi:endonuclease/exonuclease/phosphatase (EEP) superfamily protein YafD